MPYFNSSDTGSKSPALPAGFLSVVQATEQGLIISPSYLASGEGKRDGLTKRQRAERAFGFQEKRFKKDRDNYGFAVRSLPGSKIIERRFISFRRPKTRRQINKMRDQGLAAWLCDITRAARPKSHLQNRFAPYEQSDFDFIARLFDGVPIVLSIPLLDPKAIHELKIREGMEFSKEQGKAVGRPETPWWDRKGYFELVSAMYELAEKNPDLQHKVPSAQTLHEKTDVPLSTVKHLLTMPIEIPYGWEGITTREAVKEMGIFSVYFGMLDAAEERCVSFG